MLLNWVKVSRWSVLSRDTPPRMCGQESGQGKQTTNPGVHGQVPTDLPTVALQDKQYK